MKNKQYKDEVKKYFAEKAYAYDDVIHQPYWVLSDKILWDVFSETVVNKMPKGFKFLDAGGGTGRWSDKIMQAHPEAHGTLFDLSPEMSNEALKKAQSGGYESRFRVINGQLEKLDSFFKEGEFDLIFNFHNVLGFVEDVPLVLEHFSKILKKSGVLVSFLPSQYHCTFFNIFIGRTDEATLSANTGKSRFTSTMPYIQLFNPTEIKKSYESVGLKVSHLGGFPNFIYPGMQETQLHGSSSSLSNLLSNPRNFDAIYLIERKFALQRDIAARSNNIFIVGVK